jgi:hypothetical protein
MGFKLALTALSQQEKFPINSIKSEVKDESQINDRPDDMLEVFLTGKIFPESNKQVKTKLIQAYRGTNSYNNKEFIDKVGKCQSLQELKKLNSKSPGPYVPEVFLILNSAFKELPCVVMEENASALYYASTP